MTALNIVDHHRLGASLVALHWGACGLPLRAFTRDGRRAVLEIGTGCVQQSDRLSEDPVLRIACRSCSREICCLTEDGILIGSNESVPRLDNVREATWSPCGRFLAILRAKTVEVWDAEDRKLVPLPAQMSAIERIAWNPNPDCGSAQFAAGVKPGVLLWSAMGMMALRVVPPIAETTVLAWQPTGRFLALAYHTGDVQLWDYRTNQRVHLRSAEDPVRLLLWDRNGAALIGASLTHLCTWNVSGIINGRHGRSCEEYQSSPLTDVAFRGTGNILATGNAEGRLELRRSGDRAGALSTQHFEAAITHLAWSASGKRLAVGLDCGDVFVVRVCK